MSAAPIPAGDTALGIAAAVRSGTRSAVEVVEEHLTGIRNIPTLLVFKNGQIVDKQVGAVPKSVLAQKLEAQVA